MVIDFFGLLVECCKNGRIPDAKFRGAITSLDLEKSVTDQKGGADVLSVKLSGAVKRALRL